MSSAAVPSAAPSMTPMYAAPAPSVTRNAGTMRHHHVAGDVREQRDDAEDDDVAAEPHARLSSVPSTRSRGAPGGVTSARAA